eukprot:507407-Rhodomonas_salina.5
MNPRSVRDAETWNAAVSRERTEGVCGKEHLQHFVLEFGIESRAPSDFHMLAGTGLPCVQHKPTRWCQQRAFDRQEGALTFHGDVPRVAGAVQPITDNSAL